MMRLGVLTFCQMNQKETNNLKSLSLSGNPMQDVSSAKAVAYALAYNVSLQSLMLVHCHLTTEGQRHVAAGAVSNSRTSLRELSGFPVGRKWKTFPFVFDFGSVLTSIPSLHHFQLLLSRLVFQMLLNIGPMSKC